METTQEIRKLERRAELREKQASDREATAVWEHGLGTRSYFRSLDTADEYRAEAKRLRQQASTLRRQLKR